MPRGGPRPGGGRPKGTTKSEGMPSHVIRVPLDVSRDVAQAIPSLRAVLDHWESEIAKNPPSRTTNARYWYLKQMIEEIRELGF
jgi:hypothetical protein